MNFPGWILYCAVTFGFLVFGVGIGYFIGSDGVLALEKDNVTCHTDLTHYKDDLKDIKQQLTDCTQNKDTFRDQHQMTDRKLATCEATTPQLEWRNTDNDEHKKCVEQLQECTKKLGNSKSTGYFS